MPDLSGFPRAAWLRAEKLVLEQASVADLGYGDPRGSQWLRTELAGWLARTRGLRADPDDIIVVTGVAQALALLARVLRDLGEIAVEDPGSRGAREELAYWGLRPVPVPVDEHGLRVDALGDLRAVLLTPAHQFPTGVVLAPRRRRDLLDWAAGADALIVEDDYDAEYRYDRAPVPALQASAPGLVAYAGSTSKTLAPGMRLGWLIPPRRLHADLVEAKHASDLGSPALPQLVLARLIASGELEQHIRLVRKRQRSRRDALLRALREHLPAARVQGIAAGLHLLITFPGRPARTRSWRKRSCEPGYSSSRCPGTVSGRGYRGSLWDTPRTPLTSCARPHGGSRRSLTSIGTSLTSRADRSLGRRHALGVGAPVPAGHGPQLADARRPGQDDEEHPADGRKQQGHAERQVTVRAHVRDVYLGAVLQDEDQQEQQDDGEEADRDPQPADPGAPDLVLGQCRRAAARPLRSGLLRCGLLRRGLLRRDHGAGRRRLPAPIPVLRLEFPPWVCGLRFRGHLIPLICGWSTAQLHCPARGRLCIPRRRTVRHIARLRGRSSLRPEHAG